MQQDNQQTYPYQTDEINLKKLINSLVARKLFIFGFSYSVYHSVVSEYPCMVIG